MLHEKYIGKRVRVKIPIKSVPGEPEHAYKELIGEITGICRFSGYNEIIKAYQITVDRTPIWPITDEDITVL
jgi:hypothetical protein